MRRTFTLGMIVSALSGCSGPEQRADFASIDPVERSLALEEAARERDMTRLRPIIQQLESSDPAVRMLAIAVLRDLTGQDLGFHPTDSESRRAEACERWWAWYEQRQSTPQPPASNPEEPAPAAT